jgi:hypothetical protein
LIKSKGTYSVSYYVPQSIDSFITGVFCNLPESFKKEGLEIRYSGKYKERAKDGTLRPAGVEVYFLELTAVALK